MQVEDHPIDYNKFEGTIPKGEYGGGTVMLWDVGWYERDGDDDVETMEGLRSGFEKGNLKIALHGKRLRGSWVLVRTRTGDPEKPQWLLIKHRDAYARSDLDPVVEHITSIKSGRTMDDIAAGRKRASTPTRGAPVKPVTKTRMKSAAKKKGASDTESASVRVVREASKPTTPRRRS